MWKVEKVAKINLSISCEYMWSGRALEEEITKFLRNKQYEMVAWDRIEWRWLSEA